MPQTIIQHRGQGAFRQGQHSNASNRQTGTSESRSSFEYPSDNVLIEILDGKAPQRLVEWAEKIAAESVQAENSLNTSQIRNIYGTVKKLELMQDKAERGAKVDIVNKLVLLKPHLSYAHARNYRVKGMEILRIVLGKAIDMVHEKKEPRFQNFCRFFEAILAYHKFYDEKKKAERGR